jgi:putative methionine-R-sulfoxide reductase with GAF domain
MHSTNNLNDLHPLIAASPTLLQRMQSVVNAFWSRFGHDKPGPRRHTSWCGFYLIDEGDESMTLICREPKPACSPIGVQGMCGRGWRDRKTFIVPDVKVLGENYIACDPRDISELVVPIYDLDGPAPQRCIGVFDVDSYERDAFSEQDAVEAMDLLREARLLTTADVAWIGPSARH